MEEEKEVLISRWAETIYWGDWFLWNTRQGDPQFDTLGAVVGIPRSCSSKLRWVSIDKKLGNPAQTHPQPLGVFLLMTMESTSGDWRRGCTKKLKQGRCGSHDKSEFCPEADGPVDGFVQLVCLRKQLTFCCKKNFQMQAKSFIHPSNLPSPKCAPKKSLIHAWFFRASLRLVGTAAEWAGHVTRSHDASRSVRRRRTGPTNQAACLMQAKHLNLCHVWKLDHSFGALPTWKKHRIVPRQNWLEALKHGAE